MENPPRRILDEIASLIGSVKSQLSLLEEKLAELSAYAEAHEQEPVQDNVMPGNVMPGIHGETSSPEDLFPGEDVTDASFHIDAGDLLKEAEHLVSETGYADSAGYGTPDPEPVQNQTEHLAVMDVLAEKEAWKKDRPGMPVKDVRSAISLNDRALFIRSLFREDPLLFSRTLSRINAMDSIDEVETALRQDFPEWDMESEVVYRFMMCVRRKVG